MIRDFGISFTAAGENIAAVSRPRRALCKLGEFKGAQGEHPQRFVYGDRSRICERRFMNIIEQMFIHP